MFKFFKSFSIVFSKTKYILLACLVVLLFFALAIYLPSIQLLKLFWSYEAFDWSLQNNPVSIAFIFFKNNTSVFSFWLTLLVSVLSGLNIAMFIFFLRRRLKSISLTDAGFVGAFISLLGIGCASCGSVVFAYLFGLSASVGFLGFLPLRGIEFGILGLFLILFSIYFLAKKIQDPLTCRI